MNRGPVRATRAVLRRWTRVLRAARARFVVPPVRLKLWRRVEYGGNLCEGLTERIGRRYVVHIDAACAKAEVMAHEVAHAIAWQVCHEDHGPVWAVIYGRIYTRAV